MGFLVLFGLVYLLFCLYLTIDMMLAMGHAKLASLPIVQKLFSVSTTQGNYSIHADEDDEDSNSSEMSDVEGGDEEVSQRPDGNFCQKYFLPNTMMCLNQVALC